MSDTPSGEAGWRVDPADPTLYRYFDGAAWTDHTAPIVPAYSGQPYAGYPSAGPPKTLSLASMIVSLASIVVALILPVLGVPAAITGLVLGILGSRREPHAKAFWLTGILVGGFVTLLSIGGVIVVFAILANYQY